MSHFADDVKRAVDEALRERREVTVLIAGRSGVGKSTLVNAMFQGNLAETGQGRPVTKNTREYWKEGVPLRLLDTRGLEMADHRETVADLAKLLEVRNRDPDADRHVHVAWLCIAEDSRRVEDAEIELHTMLARVMPVVGVITRARADRGFRAQVQALLPNTRNVVRVLAVGEELDDGHAIPARGLVELVELTIELLPEARRRAFAAAQKASLSHKQKHARIAIGTATTAAASIAAANPIPVADAVLIVPAQLAMLAGISASFGLALSTGFLTTLLAAATGSTAATITGRAIVAALLKYTGVGTAAGALLAAATAASLTLALGEAYVATLTVLFERHQGESPSADEVFAEFRAQVSRS